MYNRTLLEGTDQWIVTEFSISLSLNVSLLREPKRLIYKHHLIGLALFVSLLLPVMLIIPSCIFVIFQ